VGWSQLYPVRRMSRKIKRNLTRAKLKDRYARVEDIDYSISRRLDKSVMLSLVSGEYLARKQNIIATGQQELGKAFSLRELYAMVLLQGTTECPGLWKI